MALSIIIPALNEAEALPATLASIAALDPPALEIILADAGSTDATTALATAAGARIAANCPANRAAQINAGAALASGDQLCILHADTLIPTDFVTLAERSLALPNTSCAGFISIMKGPQKTRWLTSAHNFIKTYYAPLIFRPFSFARGVRLLFGDQVMVMRADTFRAVGGFDPKHTIMEEADICLRLVRGGHGRIRQTHRKVWSSDRRVAKWGPLKANFIYLYIGALWGLGVSPEFLKRAYEDVR